MKLLYVIKSINGTNGQTRIIALKANYFFEHYGYEVVIVAIDEKDEHPPFYELNQEIKVHYLSDDKKPETGRLARFSKLKKLIKAESPSIVIVVVDEVYGLFFPILLRLKYPFIYERHISKTANLFDTKHFLQKKRRGALKFSIENIKGALKHRLMNIGGRSYTKLVLLSNDHSKEWEGLNNLEVINNPMVIFPETRANLDNKLVLAVGRLDPQKGYDYLLKSWKDVAIVHKDWKLAIYGKKFEMYNELKDLVAEYDIEDSVTFFDPVSNIKDVYLEASILALPSRYEGFPLVLIEAMSCGLPPVAFNCPHGVNELVEDGDNGLMVDIGDTTAFSKSLLCLIDNEDLRKRMGEKAAKSILKLAPKNIFPQWVSLFEEVQKKS